MLNSFKALGHKDPILLKNYDLSQMRDIPNRKLFVQPSMESLGFRARVVSRLESLDKTFTSWLHSKELNARLDICGNFHKPE